MALAGVEQALAKSTGKVGLELCDARFVDSLVAARARREALNLGDIARRRDHQASGANDVLHALRPPIDRLRATQNNALRRAFALAERREHAAGEPGGVAAKLMAALEDGHLGAALGKLRRAGEADDARADHAGAHHSAAST